MALSKNAEGLTGFPTPDEPAGEDAYLLFYFPDPVWVQYIIGACRNLTSEYNWYQSGDLSPLEAADAFDIIVQDAPANKLPSCSLPTGEPLMRIDPSTGHIQSVDDAGNWQNEPSIPATPARPSGLPDDQRCDAAANTANALEILYENLTDSWSHGLTVAEAITAFVLAVGETIALAFFPPAAALIAAVGLIFEAVYATIEFVGADVWTTDFTDVLRCYLYVCSSVDADVVTYDFQCIIDKLVAQTDAAGLSDTQLRLFGQLYYILNFIGVDGLNYAGAATTITGADCSGCSSTWCYDFEDGSGLPDWTVYTGLGGSYNSGTLRWEGTVLGAGSYGTEWGIGIYQDFSARVISDVSVRFGTSYNDGGRPTVILYLSGSEVARINSLDAEGATATNQVNDFPFGAVNADRILVFMAGGIGPVTVDQIIAHGEGSNPFGADNC